MKLIPVMINLQITGRVQKDFFAYRHGKVTVICMRKAFNTLACCFNELLIILQDTRKKALAAMEPAAEKALKKSLSGKKKKQNGNA
jgi:hypothetical protein